VLFCFLARKICADIVNVGEKYVVSTLESSIVNSSTNYESSLLQHCSHEEADTRVLLHVADQVKAGYSKITLCTVNTDVVVLAVAFCQQLHCDELWVAFGTGQHLRYISVHELLMALGPCRANALQMFHALTGCDTVSPFVGRGKTTCWEVWQKNPDVTAAFEELGTLPATISPQALALVEQYVFVI
jgi:hypothetical protein